MQPLHFIISRTDSIGDVVLTLPIAGILKDRFPAATISFLGQPYTRAVIDACPHVDAFMDEAAFLKKEKSDFDSDTVLIHVFPKKEIAFKAKKLGISMRIGTKSRWYHWLTCNKLVWLKRKKSDLHEAQLNVRLLAPLVISENFSKQTLSAFLSLDHTAPLPEKFQSLIQAGKIHVILHPKSKGSALEWGVANFAALANALDTERFQIFVTGTQAEKEALRSFFKQLKNPVTDLSGQMSLPEFMAFIKVCDALVANSTGPLHIAAAMGKLAIGLYPSVRPMHAGRWAPLGKRAIALSARENDRGMSSIQVEKVLAVLDQMKF